MVQAVTQPDYFAAFERSRAGKRAEKQLETDEKFRGLQMEKLEEEITRARRKEKKALDVEQMTSDVFNLKGRAREQGMNRLFAADPAAGKGMQAFQGERTSQKNAEQDRLKTEYEHRLGGANDLLKDAPPEKQLAMAGAMIQSALDGGFIDQDDARARWESANNNINDFIEQTDKDLGRDAPPVGGMKTFINSQTGEKMTRDATDYSDRKEIRELGKEWTEVSPTQTIKTGKIELPKAEATKLHDYESTTTNFLTRGQSILDLLGEKPDANTLTASFQKFGSNMIAEADALMRATGFESIQEEIDGYSESDTRSYLQKQGIANAELQSQLIALAYMQAKMFDRGGRVTEADFRYALESLGGNYANPEIFSAVLKNSMRLGSKGFVNDFEIRKEEPYTGTLGGYLDGQAGAPEGAFPVGTERPYQGETYRFKGGENIQDNWEVVGG